MENQQGNNQQLQQAPATGIQLLKNDVKTLSALLSLNSRPGTNVEAMAMQEIEYLRMHCVTKPDLMQCIPQTVLMAVKSVLKNNLSLDPNAGLVYVKTRNIKVGDEWQKVIEITPTCNGLISVARQCGRIIDYKRPSVTKDDNGRVISVKFEYQLPNNRWEAVEFDESDFERWRRASDKENGKNKADGGAPGYKYANDNYTNWKGGVDPEFARAKAIRHGLKKLGTNVNERSAVAISPAPMAIIVEESADQAANEDGYQQHEEISSTSNNAASNHTNDDSAKSTVHKPNQNFDNEGNGQAAAQATHYVTTHEVITTKEPEIPNLKEL